MLFEALGKKTEAHEAYNKVLGIEPENALALNNLAYLNADSGQNLDQAMTFAQRAKQKAPDNPDVADTLGYVLLSKKSERRSDPHFPPECFGSSAKLHVPFPSGDGSVEAG